MLTGNHPKQTIPVQSSSDCAAMDLNLFSMLTGKLFFLFCFFLICLFSKSKTIADVFPSWYYVTHLNVTVDQTAKTFPFIEVSTPADYWFMKSLNPVEAVRGDLVLPSFLTSFAFKK